MGMQGFLSGLAEGTQEKLTKLKADKDAFRDTQTQQIFQQMTNAGMKVADYRQKISAMKPDDPQRGTLTKEMESLEGSMKQMGQQVRSMHQHDLPGLVQKIRGWIKPSSKQEPKAQGEYNIEPFVAGAPPQKETVDETQKIIAGFRAKAKAFEEMNPNATEEEKKRYLQRLFNNEPETEKEGSFTEKKIPGSALPEGTKDAFGNPRDAKINYTLAKDGKYYPEASAPAKPPVRRYDPTTHELTAIEDPNTGQSWDAGTIGDAPENIKGAFTRQKEEEKQAKFAKQQEQLAKEQRTFKQRVELIKLQTKEAFDKKDYAGASLAAQNAENTYMDAVDRQKTMFENLRDARKGSQQAMLSLVANHIGMTLGAQKGSRINRAVWEEAINSTGWLASKIAKFFHRGENGDMILDADLTFDGWKGGVTLTDDQMVQMLKLADDRVKTLKEHRDDSLAKRNQLRSGSTETPGSLKNKANQGGIINDITKALDEVSK